MAKRRIYVDIETFSRIDLRAASVYRYVEDEQFEIMMAAWSDEGDEVYMTIGPEDTLAEFDAYAADPDVVFVAHNAPFERICFSAAEGLPVGTYLSPRRWHDTMAIAGEKGYPMGLDALAKALGGAEKDSAGTALINWFCKPDRNGKRRQPKDHPEKWAAFVEYCRQDVVALIDIDVTLGDWPTNMERQIWYADQDINDHGIPIDVEMVDLAIEAASDNRMIQEIELMHLTGVTNPGSNPQMMAWVGRAGLPMKNLQAATVERVLKKKDLDPEHRRVLELRQDLALVAAKKFTAARDAVNSDGRVRGGFFFFGAHTGRWAGRKVQLQNLPSEQFRDENGDWDGIAEGMALIDLMLGNGADSLTLKRLVRAMFIGPFTVVDYAAIEARVLAWLAGEEWAIEAFRQGRDIYVETAERMSTPTRPLTRKHGKVAVLALGFQGAINSLRVMGAEGSDEELDRLVHQWRRANRNIVRLWKQMQDAIARGGKVGPHITITRDGSDMSMHLPSGRSIEYHGVRWEKYKVRDNATGRMISKEGWRYDDPKKPGVRIGTYGGRLVENATQATARDIMAAALVRLRKAGYDVCLHVHDEIGVMGTHPVEDINRIMTKVPAWATGMPIDGAGFNTARYRKD